MIADFKKVKKRGTLKSIFFSIFLGLIFLATISFLVFSNWKINQKRTELQNKIDNLKKEIENLETKKTDLEAGISQTAEEIYWEEKIREQGYKKPGEEQVVVLPPEELLKSESTGSQNLSEKILELGL